MMFDINILSRTSSQYETHLFTHIEILTKCCMSYQTYCRLDSDFCQDMQCTYFNNQVKIVHNKYYHSYINGVLQIKCLKFTTLFFRVGNMLAISKLLNMIFKLDDLKAFKVYYKVIKLHTMISYYTDHLQQHQQLVMQETPFNLRRFLL